MSRSSRGRGVLIDTDVLVDHLRGARRLRLPRAVAWISVVTRAELFSGASAEESEQKGLAALLSIFDEIEVNRAIAERGGRIRRLTGVPLPDSLIAASALERGLVVMTRNQRHFARVDGITLHDPDAS